MYFNKAQSVTFKNALMLISAGLLTLTMAALFWSCNKSLGLLDESYILLSSQFPHTIKFSPTAFQFYTAFLYHLAHHNIIIFRIYGILLTLAAIPILYLGSVKIFNYLKIIPSPTYIADKINIFCFISLGALLQYNCLLVVPTYNSLDAFSLNLSAGFLFLLLPMLHQFIHARFYSKSLAIAIGLCIGFMFFIKFPPAIILFFAYSLTLLIFPSIRFLTKLKYILIIIFGILSWVSLHFLLVQSPANWWNNFHDGLILALQTNNGHDLSILKKYLSETILLFKTALTIFKLPLLISTSGMLFLYFLKLKKTSFFSILILFVFLVTLIPSYQYNLLTGAWQNLNLTSFYLGWIFLLLIIFTLIWFPKKSFTLVFSQEFKKEFILCLMLFFLPFMGAIGTNNPIYLNMVVTLVPWFLLIVFLLIKIASLQQNLAVLRFGLIMLGFELFIQITSGVLYHPYDVYTKLSDQNTPCVIGQPETKLKLDKPSCEFITQYRNLAQTCGFKVGDNVLSFYDFPGLVFVLGARSPIAPWYSKELVQAPIFINQALKDTDFKNSFLVISTDDPQLQQKLCQLGISLTSYQYCGSVHMPAEYPAPFKNRLIKLYKP